MARLSQAGELFAPVLTHTEETLGTHVQSVLERLRTLLHAVDAIRDEHASTVDEAENRKPRQTYATLRQLRSQDVRDLATVAALGNVCPVGVGDQREIRQIARVMARRGKSRSHA